jgi:tRNA1(Val) A37 N6-methylase TrmN6
VFCDADLTDDAFLGGRLQLFQPKNGYRAATDPVLMAACVAATAGQSVLDLGCGVGTAGLCLAMRVPGLMLTGLEVQADYADLARRNAARAGVGFDVVEASVLDLPPGLRGTFDHVMANPPYYPSSGTPARDAGRDIAMRQDVPLADWLDAATRRLAPGGWLTLILRADRLDEGLRAMDRRLGSISVLPLTARTGAAAGRIVLRARKGGRGALRLLFPLILHEGAAHDGDRDSQSARANAVLRGGAGLCDLFL